MRFKRLFTLALGMLLYLGSALTLSAQNSGDGYDPTNPADPSDPSTMLDYEVSVSTATPEAGTQSGAGTYKYGKSVTVKTTVNSGYKFQHWLKDDEEEPYSTATSFNYTVAAANVSFVAVFEKLKTVTLAMSDTKAGSVTGAGKYAKGTEVTIKATTKYYYKFLYWSADGGTTAYTTEPSFIYTIEDADVTFTAVYDSPGKVNLQLNESAAGKVSYSYCYSEQDPDTQIQSAAPVVGTSSSTSFALPYGNGYKYSTTESIYTPTEIGGQGKIRSIAYNVAKKVSLSNTSVSIYMGHKASSTFSSISDYMKPADLTLVYSGKKTLGSATGWEEITLTTPFDYNGDDNLVVVVTRSSTSVSSSLEYYYTSISNAYATLYRQSSSSSNYASISNTSGFSRTTERPNTKFGIDLIKSENVYARITTTPNAKFSFLHWLRNDETEPYTTDQTFDYKADQDVTFTAVYAYDPESPADPTDAVQLAAYHVDVEISDPEAGMVAGTGKYAYDKEVTISTSANAGYEFRKWLKDGVEYGTQTSFKYTVEAQDVVFRAVYEYVGIPEPEVPDTYHLYFMADPVGSCTFSLTSGKTYEEGAAYSVTATVAANHDFVGWYIGDEQVGTSKTYNGTMGTEDVTLVARCLYNPSNPDDPTFEYEPGDVNVSFSTSIGDVATLINYINGNKGKFVLARAGDLNKDGSIDEQDVQLLVNKILKKTTSVEE